MNELKKCLFLPKTLKYKSIVVKSYLSNTANFLNKKPNLIPAFNNMINVYDKELDYLNRPFTLTRSSFPPSCNLNKKNKRRLVIAI